MAAIDDEPASDARREGAVFAPTRVRGSGAPRILAAVVVIAVGAMIAVGALDRQPAPETATVAVGTDATLAQAPASAADSSLSAPRGSLPFPIVVEGPDANLLIQLDVRPAGSHLIVHGDVFSTEVSQVTVRLQDSVGHVAAVKSVLLDVPDDGTAFRFRSIPRFDVHFDLPDEVQSDGFAVSADAFDARGKVIFETMSMVARSSQPM